MAKRQVLRGSGHRVAAMAAVLGCLLIPAAMADVVVVRQGTGEARTLQGEVVSVTRREVILRIYDGASGNGSGTEIPLSRDSVLEIIFSRHRIDLSPDRERQLLSRPLFTRPDAEGDSAPVPEPPSSTVFSPGQPYAGDYKTVFSLLDSQGSVNDDVFILLSRFKGMASQATYAGLYNFDNKGTFWVRLPQPMPLQGELRFDMFGKQNNGPAEGYGIKARFLDPDGRLLEESPLILYNGGNTGDNFSEWFEHLDGISGLGGRQEVSLSVPPGTKTIELRAASVSNPERHLVGYIGFARVMLPQYAREYGE